jgi:outer membrane protein, heavy metal efflux system
MTFAAMNTPVKLLVSLILIFPFVCIGQNNLTLHQALNIARNNHPQLNVQRLNIHVAQADLLTASLKYNPILNNQTLQLLNSREFSENSNWYFGQNRQVWWQLTKPFQIAGQRKNKIDLADKNVVYEEKNLAELERNLFLEVAIKWLDVWLSEKQLELIEYAKSNIDSLISINQLRYKNEVITATDLQRTELLAKQYNIQYNRAFQTRTNQKNELKFFLGIEDDLVIDTNESHIYISNQNLTELIEQSKQIRSDAIAAKSLIEISKSNISLQKSLAYPQPELGIIWNPQNSVPYLGLYGTIDLPFFNKNQGEIKKATILKEQAEKDLLRIEAQIQTELIISFENYNLHQNNLNKAKELIDQSQSILENVQYAYLKGGTTIIDFLEAQRSWLESREQYYEALYMFKKSYIELLYSTGLINQLSLW